jgi:(p)ppGpp synthase/HD superfamily hydrolase
MSNLATAIALTSEVFKDVTDKAGQPYILHCLKVMETVGSTEPELMQIAVMHDVVEDTHYTIESLLEMGFSLRVVNALTALTHIRYEPYDNYIERVAENKDAIKVKLADLRHNSDIHRMKGLREKDFKRLEKYHRAYAFLTSL